MTADTKLKKFEEELTQHESLAVKVCSLILYSFVLLQSALRDSKVSFLDVLYIDEID